MHLLCSGQFSWLDLVLIPGSALTTATSVALMESHLKKTLPAIFQKSFIIKKFYFFFSILLLPHSFKILWWVTWRLTKPLLRLVQTAVCSVVETCAESCMFSLLLMNHSQRPWIPNCWVEFKDQIVHLFQMFKLENRNIECSLHVSNTAERSE